MTTASIEVDRQKSEEAAAAEANAKFRTFFEQGSYFAGVMTLDGTLVEANRLCLDACGFTRDEVIGKKFWDCGWWNRSPALMEMVREGSRQAAAGQLFRKESTYFIADGSERVVDLIIAPVTDEDGRVLFLAPTGTDITERKEIEGDRLKFVTLAENSTDFIGMCDLEGIPFYVNPAGLKMVGLDSLDEARRTSVREFFFPEDQGRIANEFLPYVLERGHGEIEIRFRHFRTGHALWMIYNVMALTDTAGRRIGFATISRDITQRRQLEDTLLQMTADLSDADRRKDEFLALLAHELRNPLAPIRNGLQLLKLAGDDRQAIEQARAMMERQLSQMVRLVDDLLDVSRITRNRLELRRERVELAAVVHSAVETSRPILDARGHDLTVSLPPTPIHLDADSTRLAQVFSNLLNNAAKYTEPGGRIWLTAERQGEEVVVTVKDTGMGIPPSMLPKVFDMFTQVDRTLERSQGGLGIGLTLVQRLVDLHGGTVQASSQGIGKGSEFVIRLPIVASPEPSLAPSAGEAAPAPARRFLVVDDNEDAANSLAELLRLTGNEAHVAYDGLDAVAAAAWFQPNVVLLDIGLPKLNGYEAARKMREEPWGQGMKLVALTGWGQAEDRRKSQAAGFDVHLVKPVDFATLMKLLAEE
jgi:PAS domain S-box-containing protein